jgi:phosphoribosylformylglycinamidine cyclo-ligase
VSLSYADTGVDYDRLDAFKIACQRAAATTVEQLDRHGLAEADNTRGESAYLMQQADGRYLAHVEEGLGTKNLIADAVGEATGDWSHYRAIGIDTVATAVNDLITVGALPVSFAAHVGVGDAAWFDNTARAQALAEGFAEGCRLSGCVWGGGETPALAGVIEPHAAVLAGSVVGTAGPTDRVAGDLRDGDAILFLAGNGVQTNGLSLCRKIAGQLDDGYATDLGNGQTFGQALLQPSVIYANFVRQCRQDGVPLRYLAHITGHGWRKLMRLQQPFVYRITTPGEPGPLFKFLMQSGPIAEAEAYATFNMGPAFAAYVRRDEVDRALAAAQATGHPAWHAGTVHDDHGRKAVEVPALGLIFEADTLRVR